MPIPGAKTEVSPRPDLNPAVFVIGAVALLGATVASGMLAADHLNIFHPPGCGDGSPCRAAAASRWGTVPGLRWPVSFVGFAYFLSMLVAWVRSPGEWSQGLKWVARLGALASLFFIGVMLVTKLHCKYCIASHICNLVFVGMSEWVTRRVKIGPPARGLAWVGAVFALASVGLGFAEAQVQQKAENDRNETARRIIEKSQPKPEQPQAKPPAGQTPPNQTSANQTPPTAPEPPIVLPTILTGRYRWGPEVAPIRIVMWSGYQCPDCRKIESQIKELRKRKDVSISIKHFPFCPDCNPHIQRNEQPNGCWAARAAEAAGILKGSDGFWKMHEWLFSRAGAFTDKDLLAVLLQFGWDSASFIQTMQGPTTMRNVRTDCEEGVAYGLHYSPMIFINGEELKGWNLPDSVIKTVDQVAAANPPARGPEGDRPPKAGDKYVADWRDATAMAWPNRLNLPALGAQGAQVKVTIFGDLLEPNTAEADRTIRDAMAGRNDMWYEFRYFPVDKTCNPGVSETKFPGACRAARAAEAANTMGGAAAYWKMHDWIQANAKTFSDQTLRQAAKDMGLDADELFRRMDGADLGKLVDTDANIGMRLHITEIPWIAVNGKHVPRWRLKDQFVLERIIEEAATPEPPK